MKKTSIFTTLMIIIMSAPVLAAEKMPFTSDTTMGYAGTPMKSVGQSINSTPPITLAPGTPTKQFLPTSSQKLSEWLSQPKRNPEIWNPIYSFPSQQPYSTWERAAIKSKYGDKGAEMYDKMTEAIKKVQESTKTQTAELQTKLDTVTKAENDKIAATWKDCLNKLDTAIKDGKWSEISTIISNYHAAANTIHAEFKPAKDALNKEIANLKTKEKQAIQDIRKSFMNQIYQLPRQNPWNWGGEFKDPGRKYITTK